MRVTGGNLRGRRLIPPKGLDIRPTSDKVREAVFNLIGQDLRGCRVLDLFAGTGAMGIDALSRGARHAVFIDNGGQALKLISRNLELCALHDCAVLINHDLRQGIPPGAEAMMEETTLIFMDPPYGKNLIPPLLKSLDEGEKLSKECLIVAETMFNECLSLEKLDFEYLKKRRYGDTLIHIIRHE